MCNYKVKIKRPLCIGSTVEPSLRKMENVKNLNSLAFASTIISVVRYKIEWKPPHSKVWPLITDSLTGAKNRNISMHHISENSLLSILQIISDQFKFGSSRAWYANLFEFVVQTSEQHSNRNYSLKKFPTPHWTLPNFHRWHYFFITMHFNWYYMHML